MRALDAKELLEVWEYGLNQDQLHKNLSILIAAYPEMNLDAIAKLSIGTRDRQLLQLREYLFGNRLRNIATCPKCSENVEWETDITTLYLNSPEAIDNTTGEYEMNHGDYRIRYRLINSIDIDSVSAEQSGKPKDVCLLYRSIIDCFQGGERCSIETLPDQVLRALSSEMEEKDPQANINIDLNCPACGHSWEVMFDIGSYLWHEINSWAERMLQTIHVLASTYGWSEEAILNMSPVRRQIYVTMADS
jgi:hypothetical protein